MSLLPSDVVPAAGNVDGGALSLDVTGYSAERAANVAAVEQLLVSPPPASASSAAAAVRPARQQERLLRRRAGSMKVWRWRSRKPVPALMRHQLLGRSRRDLRRAVLLRARVAACGGLETEAWHAKRFEMVRLFGVRLPWRACDRAETSAVRAANETCVLHDASYWRCLSLCGERAPLLTLLARTTDQTVATLEGRLGIFREVVCTLHSLDAAPAAAVGPVRLLPSHSTGAASVWLFIHGAAAGHAQQTLSEAASALGGAVRVARAPPLLRFQLRGPTSHSVLSRALTEQRDVNPTDSPPPPLPPSLPQSAWLAQPPPSVAAAQTAFASAWRALTPLSSPSVLPAGVVLGGTFVHPDAAAHPTPPPRRDVHGNSSCGEDHAATARASTPELRALVTAWPSALAASNLYDEGAEISADSSSPAASTSLSLLLVQQPPAAHEPRIGGGHRSAAGGASVVGGVSSGFGCGWDVLVPAGSSAGRAVWRALVLAGARAVGQRDLRAICLHADQPLFPFDSPDTLAGLQTDLYEAQTRKEHHARRPPKRRPNHAALRVQCPFGADWPRLLGVPPTIAPPADAAAAAPSTEASVSSSTPTMQFGLLRGEHALAVCGGSTSATHRGGKQRAAASGGGSLDAAPLPPLLRALLPRMLVRVAIRFPGKGCPHPPAAIHAARDEDLQAWRAGCRKLEGSTRGVRLWGGTTLPARARAAVPAGELLGFVSNGGFNRIHGKGTALGFVAAAAFAERLRGELNLSGASGGPLLVLVRNPSSRQFRPALAAVRI